MAAAQEERFTRKKHDASFPEQAIRYVLEESGFDLSDVDSVCFYDKPYIKFERLLETYHIFSPSGLRSFLLAMPIWIKEKLFFKKLLNDALKKIGPCHAKLYFSEHHLSHAASAFYPSPFDNAAILTLDGVGEWATTTIGYGHDNQITILSEINFPHSLGLLYSAFTYYCGFKVNSGEYKLMGLAPYGNRNSDQTKQFKKLIETMLIDIRDDGSFLLNMTYFNYATGLTMTKDKKWEKLFGFPRREPDSDLNQSHMNLALAIQQVTEGIIIKLAKTARKQTKSKNLVLAGGVALNCVANGKLLKENIFDRIWIQPAAGDAGGALGAAQAVWHISSENPRVPSNEADSMNGCFLGPAYTDKHIETVSKKYQAHHDKYLDFNQLTEQIALYLDQGLVIGWFQGRMEFGPRALGGRSIIADPRKPDMQNKLNLKIKFREGFRPFAPAVLEEDVQSYFDIEQPSPYMLVVAPVKEARHHPIPHNYNSLPLYERLYHLRSDLPSITHVDYSARIQTVHHNKNPQFYELLNAFKKRTGCSVLINTSFNVRGEPIVCTPEDAYNCFMRTEMDILVLNNYVFKKENQPELEKN